MKTFGLVHGGFCLGAAAIGFALLLWDVPVPRLGPLIALAVAGACCIIVARGRP